MQNYYQIATEVNADCSALNRAVMTIFSNRLNTQKGSRLKHTGRKLTEVERKRYGKSKMLRYVAGSVEPIYPIGYVQHKHPMNKKRSICSFTAVGRSEIHNNLKINTKLMLKLLRQLLFDRSTEYADNRISLFSAQWGKCAVTGKEFAITEDIHCHHIIPRWMGETDKYENLVLVLEPVHELIHARTKEMVDKYMKICDLDKEQLKKLNKFRVLAGNAEIA